jgi:hypothetical protein
VGHLVEGYVSRKWNHYERHEKICYIEKKIEEIWLKQRLQMSIVDDAKES